MQCKKALEEAGGDMAKALEVLRTMSAATAEKKSDRTLGAGVIESYIHANKKVGVLLELNCETDFVSQNDDFKALAKDLVLHIAAMPADDVAGLLEQPFIKNPDLTVKQLVDGVIQKTGENIAVARFTRYAMV